MLVVLEEYCCLKGLLFGGSYIEDNHLDNCYLDKTSFVVQGSLLLVLVVPLLLLLLIMYVLMVVVVLLLLMLAVRMGVV